MATHGGPTAERFELERFSWASPDRLEVSGRFAGLAAAPHEAPVLVVKGADRVHRLPAVPDSSSGAPEEGQAWHVTFAWAEPPEPFSTAELEVGEVAVTLPAPGTQSAGTLPVHHQPAGAQPPRGNLRDLRAEAERARAELEAAQEATVAALAAELAEAIAERDALRERVLALEAEASRTQATVAGVANARDQAGEVIAAGEQLVARLHSLRDGLGEAS